MDSAQPIVEEWFARTVESYPAPSQHFLACEADPFRNPVGHALRRAMTVLVSELQAEMKEAPVRAALDSILQIRAVQDLSPSEAVGFVFLLRPILLAPGASRPAMLEARIDRLALMAFDSYMSFRERVAAVRAQERHRVQRARGA